MQGPPELKLFPRSYPDRSGMISILGYQLGRFGGLIV